MTANAADAKPPQTDEQIAEMIARFRTPQGFSWEDLRNDILTVLKTRPQPAPEGEPDFDAVAKELLDEFGYDPKHRGLMLEIARECAQRMYRLGLSQQRPATSVEDAEAWRCFNCGEVFTDKERAAEHFGVSTLLPPGCMERLTPEQHAKVWHEAARVVAAMDTMGQGTQVAWQNLPLGGGTASIGRHFSNDEMDMNKAYRAAAAVLNSIATAYEQAGDVTLDSPHTIGCYP